MIATSNKLKVSAVETDAGYFIKEGGGLHFGNGIRNYFFDGVCATPTFHNEWYKIESKPRRVHRLIKGAAQNQRYELFEKCIASDKIPLVLRPDEVKINDDGDWEAYSNLKSLYIYTHDLGEDTEEDVDFEFNVILKIDNIKGYAGLNYPIQKTNWKSDGLICVTDKDVSHQEIDKIIFPDLVLPSRPSQFTSHQSFDIVRQHIKTNINPVFAEMSSDYDFCFQVNKKIKLCEDEPYQVNVARMNKRAKYKTRYRSDRKVKIFEMTYSPKNYNGYTPIQPFRGQNHEGLMNNIDSFLRDLMAKINEPLIDCPKCNGMGVII